MIYMTLMFCPFFTLSLSPQRPQDTFDLRMSFSNIQASSLFMCYILVKQQDVPAELNQTQEAGSRAETATDSWKLEVTPF